MSNKNIQRFNVSGGVLHSVGNVEQHDHEPVVSAAESRQPGARILFLAANPAGSSPLRLDQEVRTIDKALRSAGVRERFELEQSWAVTFADLQEGLLRFQPDLVHWSGHGNVTGELAFEAEALYRSLRPPAVSVGLVLPDTDQRQVPVAALAQLFSLARGKVRCVVLNACYSEEQARTIAESIDCVIGMSSAITDESAIRFSASFYGALAYGQSVRTSFELACVQVRLNHPEEAHLPQLLAVRSDPAELFLLPRL
jgi:CHAT domain